MPPSPPSPSSPSTHGRRCCCLLTALVAGLTAIATPASGQVINEDFKILASDAAIADWFGFSIAIDNGIVAVGAGGNDDNGIESGSAYLFEASTGVQIAKLLPNDGAVNADFGRSIAISNGIVAVGAPGDDANGINSGSAYLFDASIGTQIAKLLSSDGVAGDNFGFSISISNGIVAVGAVSANNIHGNGSGSAYLFDASTGVQISKLLPNDGASRDSFGWSIAISNGIVAVGARADDDNGLDSGSAYLFSIDGAQTAKLLPSDGAARDQFGFSIAIANGVVAVGSIGDDDNGPSSGSAYLFEASSGLQFAKLIPSDGAENDLFGSSIGISNGTVVIGAKQADVTGADSGSAYLFDTSAGVHNQITRAAQLNS